MANRTDSRRLDELVKQSLSSYEPADTASDWSKMEGMLGTAPKIVAPSFKFPSFSVSGEGAGFVKGIFSSYIFFVVLMLAGGGYLLYTILKAPKQDAVLTAPLVDSTVNKPAAEPPVVLNTAPVENKPVAEKPEVAKDTVAVMNPEPAKKEEKAEDPKIEKETREAREKREAKEAKEKKDAELAEKREKEKREKVEAEKLKAEKKKEEAKKKEKERLAKAEKEKKEASKETLKKSNNPVGLNFLRSVNLDSLKKQQSQEQPVQQPVNDTAKGQ